MVKLLGPEEQPARPMGERDRNLLQGFRGPRSHHQWGIRFGRQREREDMKSRQEPTSLDQLEDLTKRMVTVIEKHAPKCDKNYQIVMRLMREQYNLNFAMVGDNCEGSYNPDELAAPER